MELIRAPELHCTVKTHPSFMLWIIDQHKGWFILSNSSCLSSFARHMHFSTTCPARMETAAEKIPGYLYRNSMESPNLAIISFFNRSLRIFCSFESIPFSQVIKLRHFAARENGVLGFLCQHVWMVHLRSCLAQQLLRLSQQSQWQGQWRLESVGLGVSLDEYYLRNKTDDRRPHLLLILDSHRQ